MRVYVGIFRFGKASNFRSFVAGLLMRIRGGELVRENCVNVYNDVFFLFGLNYVCFVLNEWKYLFNRLFLSCGTETLNGFLWYDKLLSYRWLFEWKWSIIVFTKVRTNVYLNQSVFAGDFEEFRQKFPEWCSETPVDRPTSQLPLMGLRYVVRFFNLFSEFVCCFNVYSFIDRCGYRLDCIRRIKLRRVLRRTMKMPNRPEVIIFHIRISPWRFFQTFTSAIRPIVKTARD